MAEQIFFAVEIETGKGATKIEKLRANFKGLSAEIKSTERAQKRGTITAKDANKKLAVLEISLIKSRKAYRDASKAAVEAEKSVSKGARAFLKAETNANKLNKKLKETKTISSSLSSTFKKAGAAMVAAFAAGVIIKGIGDAVRIIKDFEQASANLASVLGKSIDQIDALKNSAKELGATTSFTASQVLKLQTELAKLGFTEDEILAATEATLALAEASGSTLEQAASVAGNTIRSLGLNAEDMTHLSDVMARSFSSTALDITKFEESMKLVAPSAKATGVELETVTAQLGVLANNGISGSMAGTQLNRVFVELNKKGLTLQEALDKVTSSQNQLGAATELVGDRGAKALLIFSQNQEKLGELEGSFKNAGGAARRMAETQLNTLEGRTKLLTSAWEGFVLSLDSGDGVISGVAKGVLEMATSILGAVTNTGDLSDQFFKMEKSVNAFDSKIVPLLDRYDELNEKTDLSVVEQEELDSLILRIADDVPLAVTEFDKYGKALDVSTEAAKLFQKEQKAILLLVNKDAIAEQLEGIDDLNNNLKSQALSIELVNGEWVKYRNIFVGRGQQVKQSIKLTGDEVLAINDKRAAIGLELIARRARIAQLRGELTEGEKALKLQEEAKGNTPKEVVAIKDLIKEKQKEITARRKVAAASKAATAIKNDDIKALQAELKALQALSNNLEGFTLRKLKLMKVELTKTDEFAGIKKELMLDVEDESVELFESETDRINAEIEREADKYVQLTSTALDGLQSVQDLTNVFTQNKLNALRRESTEELAIINDRERKGLLSRDQAEQARRRLSEETDKKAEVLEKKAFKRNKAFNIASAIINTAAAVSLALASAPPPVSFITAGTTAVLGAAEVATIAAQKFGKGGIISGPSHSDGGVPIMGGRAEVEGDEIILTRGVTHNPTLAAMANQINVMGGGDSFMRSSGNNFEHGGVLSTILPTFELPQNESLSGIVDAIRDIQINSVVRVSEISSAQSNVAVSEGLATIG